MLATAFPHKGYYVVSFEAVNESAEAVIALKPLLKFVVVEVGSEVGEATILCPNLVASVEELIGKQPCVHAEECAVLYADVVEAHVLRVALEATALLLVVGEAVEVVVNGVVIDHLRDREVPKKARVVGSTQVLAEDLHEERFAHTDTALQEDALVQFVATTGKDLLSQWAVVEVVEQEAQHVSVVVVDDELAPLRSKYHGVGNVNEERAVSRVNTGVGKVVGLPTLFLYLVTEPQGSIMKREPSRGILPFVAASLQDASVPFDIASRTFAVLGKFIDEGLRIRFVVHNSYRLNVLTTETAIELIRWRRQLRVAVMLILNRGERLAHP